MLKEIAGDQFGGECFFEYDTWGAYLAAMDQVKESSTFVCGVRVCRNENGFDFN